MSLRTLTAMVPLSDGSPFTGTLRVLPLEEIIVDGMNVAVVPVDHPVIAGELPSTAKIVAPGRYSFTLLDGEDEVQCFEAVVPDGTTPVSLFDLRVGTYGEAPIGAHVVLLSAGSSVLLLVPGGGADGQFLMRIDASTLAWGAAPSATWSAIAGKPATFPPEAHAHAVATALASGFMAVEDKGKLDGIAPGATANAADGVLLDRANHTGKQPIGTIEGIGEAAALDVGTAAGAVAAGNHAHAAVTTTAPGFMSGADKAKLDAIAPGATANAPDAALLDRASHTGTQGLGTIVGIGEAATLDVGVVAGTVAAGDHTHDAATTAVPGFMSVSDKAKLGAIAADATANAPDVWLLDRANHTGMQELGTIVGIGDAATMDVGTTVGTVAAGDHTHAAATANAPGFMSVSDKAKLDGITSGATANASDAFLLAREHHTGMQPIGTIEGIGDAATLDVGVVAGTVAAGDHTHVAATANVPGFMSVTDKAKLDAIAPGATANAPDAVLLDRANHTGTQPIGTIDGLGTAAAMEVGVTAGTVAAGNHAHGSASSITPGFMTAADKAKLDGIVSGATANAPDVWLLDRENHTGTQPIETIDGLGAAAALNVGLTAGTVAPGDHVHPVATAMTPGFMSAADKVKLNGLAAGGGGSVLPAPVPYTFSTRAIGFNITNAHSAGAPLEFNNGSGTGEGRLAIDLEHASSIRLNVSVASTTQPAGCTVTAQYSADSGATWSYFHATALNAAIGTPGQKLTAWTAVPPEAAKDVLVRVVGYGGAAGSSSTVAMVKLDVR